MPRRYVLFRSEKEIRDQNIATLEDILERRFGKVKVIPVKGDARSVIVRTTTPQDRAIREADLQLDGVSLRPVLTSGVIGKLKRAATSSKDDER